MILPSKHLSQDRALLTVGAEILRRLPQPVAMSTLWEEMQRGPSAHKTFPPMRYNAFVLALDLLFLIGVIAIQDGLLVRRTP